MVKDVVSKTAEMLVSGEWLEGAVPISAIAKEVRKKEEEVESILLSSGFFSINIIETKVRKFFWYEKTKVKGVTFANENEIAKAYLSDAKKTITLAQSSKILLEKVLLVVLKNQISCLSERYQERIVNTYQHPKISREYLYSKYLPGELGKYEFEDRESVSLPKKWLTAKVPAGLEFKFSNGLEANNILSWLKSIQLSEPEVVHGHLVNGEFESWLRKNSNWEELANMLASISRKCVEEKINAEEAKTLLISYLRRTPAEAIIYEHTIKPLIKKLETRDEQTLIETANKLGLIGDERAVEPLIGRLVDSSVKVRSAILHALGKIGDVSATPFIIKVIKNSQSKEDRINAIRAAGLLKDERAVDIILEYVHDKDSEISRESVKALGEIGNAKAISKLKEFTNGENEIAKVAFEVLKTKEGNG